MENKNTSATYKTHSEDNKTTLSIVKDANEQLLIELEYNAPFEPYHRIEISLDEEKAERLFEYLQDY